MVTIKNWLFLITPAILITYSSTVQSQIDCGDPFEKSTYIPDDYLDPSIETRKHLQLVESAHFFPNIEFLRSTQKEGALGRWEIGSIFTNIDYTLRHFPNHHRALHAISKYERRERAKSVEEKRPYRPPTSAAGFPGTAECYFIRAIQFRPKDSVVHLIYGIHLHSIGEYEKALEKYKQSEKLSSNSAELHYNLGLLYFDMKQYELARKHADKAYRLGYPLPGLRSKLSTIR